MTGKGHQTAVRAMTSAERTKLANELDVPLEWLPNPIYKAITILTGDTVAVDYGKSKIEALDNLEDCIRGWVSECDKIRAKMKPNAGYQGFL